jgi:hypothetical protein
MSKEVHSKRESQAKAPGREGKITAGGIETCVEGFMGDITTESPFKPTYGNHKGIGSENLPMVKGGRGSKSFFRNKLNTGGN